LEKEKKLKYHLDNYVTYLKIHGITITDDMIENETKRFQQVLETEEE
jgi:hypothetical protein